MKRKIPDKYLHSSPRDKQFLLRALNDKQLSGTSDTVSSYECSLSEYFNSQYVVALSSGSVALHAALKALDVRKGDEVIVPALSTLPTVFPIITAGASIVLVDTDKDTFNFDPKDLKKKITKKTKAAILVPLWGYPIDYIFIKKQLDEYNIPLIEDCAQSHGSTWHNRHFGTFGTIGCFSTHDRKILSTGEGGFILTQNRSLADTIRTFSRVGDLSGKLYGVNYKLSALQAAVGLSRIPDIEKQIAIRTNNAIKISQSIESKFVRTFQVIDRSRPNYYSLLLRISFSGQKNASFIQYLQDQGIPSDITKYHHVVLNKREMFRKLKGNFPHAENLLSTITSIPVHPGLRTSDIEYIIQCIRRAILTL